MKLRTFVLALLILSFIASYMVAEETRNEEPPVKITKIAGANSFGSETLDSLQGAGLVKLNGTSILNSIQITGSLIARNAQIGSLEISGEANLTNSTVHNKGNVIGSLQTVGSTFEQRLTLMTQKAVFTSSHFEGINVLKDMGCKGKQILELRKGSIINGPVHFESGKGEILVYPGSQVFGPVTGGKIIKKS